MDISAEFFRRLAAAAARETLPHFRRNGAVSNKETDRFDPVTEADRAAERAIRAMIAEAYPGHGILGEEFGAERADSRHVWVIDPIDGTRSFISGIPLWGTLVGLTEDGDAVAGMMAQPFTGELFYALGDGAFYEGPSGGGRLSARTGIGLAEAVLFTTTPSLFLDGTRPAFDRLEASVRMSRYGADCYAYAMLAAGSIDLVVETGLHAYDVMGLIPVVEQAGGVMSGWDGGPAERAGRIVAAASPALHEAALEILNRG